MPDAAQKEPDAPDAVEKEPDTPNTAQRRPDAPPDGETASFRGRRPPVLSFPVEFAGGIVVNIVEGHPAHVRTAPADAVAEVVERHPAEVRGRARGAVIEGMEGRAADSNTATITNRKRDVFIYPPCGRAAGDRLAATGAR